MLTKAHEDLSALGGMLDEDTFSDAIFGFHAQQAVEKALKACLSIAGLRYSRVHDLEALANLLSDDEVALPQTS